MFMSRERFDYVSTSVCMSIVCVKERFDYLRPPAHVSVIPVEG